MEFLNTWRYDFYSLRFLINISFREKKIVQGSLDIIIIKKSLKNL